MKWANPSTVWRPARPPLAEAFSENGESPTDILAEIARGGREALPYRSAVVLRTVAGVGSAKAVTVELAAQLADMSGRAIGEHYAIGATGLGANRRRLVSRPDVLQVVENARSAITGKEAKVENAGTRYDHRSTLKCIVPV